MSDDQRSTVSIVAPKGDPDPDGDVIFLLGEAKEPIRVSSKVMSLASPVFKAMLDPRFVSKPPLFEDPPKIPLPEDDPKTMSWMCSALHHREIGGPISRFACKKLAILCDKYMCCVALRSWSDSWFRAYLSSHPQESADGLLEFVWLAIAFDNQREFGRTTRDVVWNVPSGLKFNVIEESAETHLVPEQLPCEFARAPGLLRYISDLFIEF